MPLMEFNKIEDYIDNGRIWDIYSRFKGMDKESFASYIVQNTNLINLVSPGAKSAEQINVNELKKRLKNLIDKIDNNGFFKLLSDMSEKPPIFPPVIEESNYQGIRAFITLASHAPYQLYRYAMDGEKQNESMPLVENEIQELNEGHDARLLNVVAFTTGEKSSSGVLEWERRERGSLAGVLNCTSSNLI